MRIYDKVVKNYILCPCIGCKNENVDKTRLIYCVKYGIM